MLSSHIKSLMLRSMYPAKPVVPIRNLLAATCANDIGNDSVAFRDYLVLSQYITPTQRNRQVEYYYNPNFFISTANKQR